MAATLLPKPKGSFVYHLDAGGKSQKAVLAKTLEKQKDHLFRTR